MLAFSIDIFAENKFELAWEDHRSRTLLTGLKWLQHGQVIGVGNCHLEGSSSLLNFMVLSFNCVWVFFVDSYNFHKTFFLLFDKINSGPTFRRSVSVQATAEPNGISR
jgi:hypothetical protein